MCISPRICSDITRHTHVRKAAKSALPSYEQTDIRIAHPHFPVMQSYDPRSDQNVMSNLAPALAQTYIRFPVGTKFAFRPACWRCLQK